MNRVRAYHPADLEQLKEMHRKAGHDYRFPDIDSPLFFSKLVLENEHGEIKQAALARLTCELYLMVDPSLGTPLERWQDFQQFHRAGEREYLEHGLDDMHAFLPPKIAQSFGRRLSKLGWLRDDRYIPFVKYLTPDTSEPAVRGE